MSLQRFKLRTHWIKIVEYLVQMEEREFRRNPRKNIIKRRLIRCVYYKDGPSSCLANRASQKTMNTKNDPLREPLLSSWYFPSSPKMRYIQKLSVKENCVYNLTRWRSVTFSNLPVFHGFRHLVHFSFSTRFVMVNFVVSKYISPSSSS